MDRAIEPERKKPPLDCPLCMTELLSCECGKNKRCPRCRDYQWVTFPCECPDGVAKMEHPLTF